MLSRNCRWKQLNLPFHIFSINMHLHFHLYLSLKRLFCANSSIYFCASTYCIDVCMHCIKYLNEFLYGKAFTAVTPTFLFIIWHVFHWRTFAEAWICNCSHAIITWTHSAVKCVWFQSFWGTFCNTGKIKASPHHLCCNQSWAAQRGKLFLVLYCHPVVARRNRE